MIRRIAELLSRGVVLKRHLPARYGGSPIFVTPDVGLKFWKPGIGHVSPLLLRLAAELVHPGAVVWDIGANVGLFSIAAAHAAGREGSVLAIEPDIDLCVLLLRSAALSAPSSARLNILPVAVSDTLGLAEFCISQRGRGSNFLQSTGGLSQSGGSRETRLVPTVILDWLVKIRAAPTIVKIDVEGAEALVLRGAQEVLAVARPTVLCEVCDATADEVTALLQGHDYTIYDAAVAVDQRRPISRAVWDTLAVPSQL